mmetsp:Transcript_12525/g.22416  ORF Transcript_12525/g.22416 Transcript_12525/m.22416 type:complete len:213 (-) Transcript_12525:215-853(-)
MYGTAVAERLRRLFVFGGVNQSLGFEEVVLAVGSIGQGGEEEAEGVGLEGGRGLRIVGRHFSGLGGSLENLVLSHALAGGARRHVNQHLLDGAATAQLLGADNALLTCGQLTATAGTTEFVNQLFVGQLRGLQLVGSFGGAVGGGVIGEALDPGLETKDTVAGQWSQVNFPSVLVIYGDGIAAGRTRGRVGICRENFGFRQEGHFALVCHNF